MEFIDTQIVSYVFKGNKDLYDGDIKEKNISSIVALEFLGIMNKDNSAKMYPTALSGFHPEFFRRLKENRKASLEMGRHATDRLVIDFNGEFDSIVIFSNEAVSKLVNEKRREELLFFAMNSLDKVDYGKFKKRLDFLLDNDIHVVPLNEEIVNKMHDIYIEIRDKYNVKDNYRNSFMDLLIVATAIVSRETLVSKDKELNKVLKEYSDDIVVEYVDETTVQISGSDEETDKLEIRKDSKGYINTGWQVMIRKGNV